MNGNQVLQNAEESVGPYMNGNQVLQNAEESVGPNLQSEEESIEPDPDMYAEESIGPDVLQRAANAHYVLQINQPYNSRIRPSARAREMIERWLTTGDIDDLRGCTFRYIVGYLDNMQMHDRLIVALGDFGYTFAQMQASTSRAIALEILARP